ncbi:NADH:flavin oxidoreductase [Haloglycomyces albus]|uniref:NADH:flavin oxidoreductase n=1 Tax=Haloglycomyces albus TaxID=526067 RepID=UPI00046D1430|nr:NADH:flavin oxidoreductase [Haloglycomyces albus]
MNASAEIERIQRLLQRPFGVGNLKLNNRIVMAPMTRDFSPDGIPGDDVAAYYARRAAADVGLIITEGTHISHPSASERDSVPRIYGEKSLAGWQRVVDAVHAEGGKIAPQLWHVGMVREPGQPPFPEAPPVGPSGRRPDGRQTGDPLSLRDIDAIVESFAEGARQAEAVGFDAVELHGAHGYLIDQFLWGRTNTRTDDYGGSVKERVKFASDIVAAVRGAVSPDFPVILRYSQWKMSDFHATIADSPSELATILEPLSEAGVDVFHASTRRFWEPEFADSDLNLAGWTRQLTGKPAISVGSIGLDKRMTDSFAGEVAEATNISRLLDRMENNEFDLAAVGRALLGDPTWAGKVLQGRFGELTEYHPDAVKTLY